MVRLREGGQGARRGGSHRSRDREGAVVAHPNNRSLPVAAPVVGVPLGVGSLPNLVQILGQVFRR